MWLRGRRSRKDSAEKYIAVNVGVFLDHSCRSRFSQYYRTVEIDVNFDNIVFAMVYFISIFFQVSPFG